MSKHPCEGCKYIDEIFGCEEEDCPYYMDNIDDYYDYLESKSEDYAEYENEK